LLPLPTTSSLPLLSTTQARLTGRCAGNTMILPFDVVLCCWIGMKVSVLGLQTLNMRVWRM